MLFLSKFLFKVLFLFSLQIQSLLTRVVTHHGVSGMSDEWDKMKWKSIIDGPGNSELSNEASTEDLKEPGELFFTAPKHDKNLERKLNLDENQIKNLIEDEVFLEESPNFHKRSGSANSAKAFFKSQINPGDLLNFPSKVLSEFSQNQDLDSEQGNTKDSPHENSKPITGVQFLKTNFTPDDFQLSQSISSNRRAPKSDIEQLQQRSFIFNPFAQAQEQFQNCTTPKNESGNCRYLQHCLIPTIVSSLNQFLDYVCIIEGRFIGVCCPSFPVSVLVIKDQKENSKNESELNEDCGVGTNRRIVGGLNADPKAWPWMVALLSKSKKKFFCGGSLINDKYVLTAAHCTFGVPNNEIIARVGEYDFKDDEESHHEYTVVEIKRHGHYNRRTLRNDIALLKLEKPVLFNESVKTICFPEEENDYVGEEAILVGWGNLAGSGPTSDVLQQASLSIISNEECSKSHGLPIPESLICTGSKSGDKGACNGDSGGPLMLLDKNNRWKVIGLVSWGRRGCSPEFPTVYTRVSLFLEWIKKHAR